MLSKVAKQALTAGGRMMRYLPKVGQEEGKSLRLRNRQQLRPLLSRYDAARDSTPAEANVSSHSVKNIVFQGKMLKKCGLVATAAARALSLCTSIRLFCTPKDFSPMPL